MVIKLKMKSQLRFLSFILQMIILALKKMVVNHIDKTFVTSDAATILK